MGLGRLEPSAKNVSSPFFPRPIKASRSLDFGLDLSWRFLMSLIMTMVQSLWVFLILSLLTLGLLGESLESLNEDLLCLQLRSYGLKILMLIN